MERAESKLPFTMQTELQSLNFRSLYYQPRLPDGEEVLLKRRIAEIYQQSSFYGEYRIACAGYMSHLPKKERVDLFSNFLL